jgi:hypothetical protein
MLEQNPEPEAPPAVRAQILATEHWSLLASRSTTQSEVLTRINMFLTLVSAGLVSLALVGQATQFSEAFRLFAIGVLAFIALVGVLTQIRVVNVGIEDLMYVLAMNRLRAAYVELDPGAFRFLMASPYDDQAGSRATYFFLGSRGSFSQIGGSSMVFMMAINSALVGLLGAAVIAAAGGGTGASIAAGVLAGLAILGISLWWGGGAYFRVWRTYEPLNPTPAPGGADPH